jgi:general secretion pathway protein G
MARFGRLTERGGHRMRSASRGFTLIELLIVVAIIGIIAAVAIPNLLNAVDKGKQKRTVADLRTIGSAVEAYSVDNSYYPNAASLPAVKAVIDPIFFNAMPLVDGWSNAIEAESTGTSYTIFSHGKDGSGTNCPPGTTSTFNDEICFVNGRLQRYPDGPQQ